MDIKQIRAFLSVANHLSFTKASEEMFMTQSSIIKIIKALEDELETQLFYRNPKIVLTDSGDFIIEMVASELGITFLPEITCSTINRPDIKFIPLEDPQINLNLLVVWKGNRYLSYSSKEWLKFAASKIGIELDL